MAKTTIESQLTKLKEEDSYRSLHDCYIKDNEIVYDGKSYLNLSSNDYLGLSNRALQKEFLLKNLEQEEYLMSNPSSRLITGNSHHYTELESKLASLYGKEAALVLSCGYMLNSGVLPSLTTKNDVIIADKLVHASIIEALKLSTCKYERYSHNSMEHLETLLKKYCDSCDNIYIVTESIFSMDGDAAPLKDIIELKERYGAKIYLDEAHAFGVRGAKGCGLAEELGVMDSIEYIIATMGKSLSSQGGFIVCDKQTRELMINRMRTLIFSTALPPISLMWSEYMIDVMVASFSKREHLQKISSMIHASLENNISQSNIIPIITGSNSSAIALANYLKEGGYWASAIRYPTVAKGSERVRISLSANMTIEQTEGLIDYINKGKGKVW